MDGVNCPSTLCQILNAFLLQWVEEKPLVQRYLACMDGWSKHTVSNSECLFITVGGCFILCSAPYQKI